MILCYMLAALLLCRWIVSVSTIWAVCQWKHLTTQLWHSVTVLGAVVSVDEMLSAVTSTDVLQW